MTSEFADAIRENLPDIDMVLASWDADLRHRPYFAACVFIERCIVEIAGDSKEDYLRKPWFADIYDVASAWYLERYGERLKAEVRPTAPGMVLLFDTLFRVEVPLVLEEEANEPRHKWICFPDEVLPHEVPLQWLTTPPGEGTLASASRAELEDAVRWVGNHTRECIRTINAIDTESADHQAMASTVPLHFVAGIEHAFGDAAARQLAVYEFHLACEKTLKLFIVQHATQFPFTHDLQVLTATAEGHGLTGVDARALATLPTAKEAIGYRYGEGPIVGPAEIVGVYRAALELCGCCGRQLRRRRLSRNMRFLIRGFPFPAKDADELAADEVESG